MSLTSWRANIDKHAPVLTFKIFIIMMIASIANSYMWFSAGRTVQRYYSAQELQQLMTARQRAYDARIDQCFTIINTYCPNTPFKIYR